VTLDGHPIAADGATLDAALSDFISALRDYASAWIERLAHAPDHHRSAGLVAFVMESDDATLLEWARSRPER